MEKKYYDLIVELIKKHKKYPGCEDILDDIAEDVYNHAKVIIGTIANEDVVNSYLSKVVSTSIITVPKKKNPNKRISKQTISTIQDIKKTELFKHELEEPDSVLDEIETSYQSNQASVPADNEIIEFEVITDDNGDESYQESKIDNNLAQDDFNKYTAENKFTSEPYDVNKDYVDKMINGITPEGVNTGVNNETNNEINEETEPVNTLSSLNDAEEGSINSEFVLRNNTQTAEFTGINMDVNSEILEEQASGYVFKPDEISEESPETAPDVEPAEICETDFKTKYDIAQAETEYINAGEESILELADENEADLTAEAEFDMLETDDNEAKSNAVIEFAENKEDEINPTETLPEADENTGSMLEISEISEAEEPVIEYTSPAEEVFEAPKESSLAETDSEMTDKFSGREDKNPQENLEPDGILYDGQDTQTFLQDDFESLSEYTALELPSGEFEELMPAEGQEEFMDISNAEGVSELLPDSGKDEFTHPESYGEQEELMSYSEPGEISSEKINQAEDEEEYKFVPPSYKDFGFEPEKAVSLYDSEEIVSAIKALDSKYPELYIKQICFLKYTEKKSVKEVAEILGINEKAVINALDEIINTVKD